MEANSNPISIQELKEILHSNNLETISQRFSQYVNPGDMRSILWTRNFFRSDDPSKVALSVYSSAKRSGRIECKILVLENIHDLKLFHSWDWNEGSGHELKLLVVIGLGKVLSDILLIGSLDDIEEKYSQIKHKIQILKSNYLLDLSGLHPNEAKELHQNGMDTIYEINFNSSNLPKEVQETISNKQIDDKSSEVPTYVSSSQFQWSEGMVTFQIVIGDIFELQVEAFVNSEQSDFRLSNKGHSISAQILRKGGVSIQRELDRKTQGKVLPLATVLETNGGKLTDIAKGIHKYIYHAAIHYPEKSNVVDGGDEADLDVLVACVREIINRASNSQIKSIAFPLLGSGAYGLDSGIVGSVLTIEIVKKARMHTFKVPIHIILVLPPNEKGWRGFQGAVQSLIDIGSGSTSWKPFDLKIPLLDPLESDIAKARDPYWRAIMLCRYAESFIHYALAVITSGIYDRMRSKLPELIKPISFGTLSGLLRTALGEYVYMPKGDEISEFRDFLARLCSEKHKKINFLVEARNKIAHGKFKVAPLDKIEEEVISLVSPSRWNGFGGFRPIQGFEPWLKETILLENNQTYLGVVERSYYDSKKGFLVVRYIEPATSKILEIEI